MAAGKSLAFATAAPPAALNSSRAAARGSQPVTSTPACKRLSAAPMPMLPNPITPTRISKIPFSKKRAQYLHQRCDDHQHQHNTLQCSH
jgi:hypothetical protein